ncbi:protein commissureless 2 homolog isoform X1 [Macrosteles quadrilineatus]|uniref:protein commissureless 2 homolog isoform X1 n=1 Tax=Macrosteles quadrilineatus TaxID=74068 RepID=UPI0023E15020|nr:protein commissureless 2 homolog isoform X1 [Macrosteles quadrilineatus]XP_054256924.1 protein commissureless 2 homolog isoform X1 [Macrosteles quadrilineatus]XP_054256925.1 protein commissureless 2 homolog isoform X1 [Macrosteles quadrilineatus]
MSEIVSLNFAPVNEESSVSVETTSNDEYDRFLSDLWVGILLTFMVLSCIVCLCTCFLVHAFRQWQQRGFSHDILLHFAHASANRLYVCSIPLSNQVLEARRMEAQVEAGYDSESLPSYTVVAGLPTYEEAIEQLKQGIAQGGQPSHSNEPVLSRLSVGDLLEIYKVDVKKIDRQSSLGS